MSRAPVARRGVGVSRLAERLDAGTILTAILVLGLALRIFIAGAYLPRSGLSNDIGAFTAWAMRLASVGPSQFYEPGYFADYPPGYMYVLWLLGTIGNALAPIVGQNATGGLVKVPGILADVGVGWMLFLICRRWGHELIDRTSFRVSAETLGVVAAALYIFNPGTIFDSSVWGQIDSVGAFLLLGTIYVLGRGWTEVAAAGAVLALLVKFQFAFLIPLVAIVGLRRHMFGRSTDASHHGKRDPLRVLTSLAVGFGAVTALLLPFRMTLYAPLSGGDPRGFLGILPAADPNRSLIGKFLEAANTYDGLTVNAFSMWRNPWSGLGDTFQRADDAAVAITLGSLALSWQQVGAVLFGAVALLAFVQVARRDDMRGVLLASLLLAIAFFVLPTRVHERYLFPALALAAPLVFSGRVWPWVYGALSLCFFANIYWVYTEDWSFAGGVINPGANGLPMPQDPLLTATVLTDVGIWLIVLLGVAVLGFVGWRAWVTAVHPRGLATTGDAALATDGDPAPLAADRATQDVAIREGRPPRRGFSWLRPNPADLYLREPTRRLDRRDAMLLLALVVFALVFRLWRLDVPRGTHFDEVYHARSATEFLSNWQNGWNRDVYEWTHPMLAKYLIAAGIVIADPNKVVGSADLDAPSPSIAVAPQRSSMGYDRSVVFSAAAGGATIVATDAQIGDEVTRWEAGGPVASIAFDPDSTRLLVGRADAGTVETYALTDLMSSDGAAAPPAAGPPITVELGAASQVEMVADSDVVLVRGPDGVAVVDSTTDSVRATATGSYGGVAWVGSTDDDAGWLAATDPERNAIVFLAGDTLELAVGAEGEEQGVVAIEPPLVGPLLTRGSGEDQQLLALTGPVPANDEHPETAGGIVSMDADAQTLNDVVPLPGAPSLLGYQPIAGIAYVAGVSAAGEPTVWPIEPHIDDRNDTSAGLAAFDATPLPAPALAMAFDVSAHGQADDHGRLVVSTGDGTLVSVDAGSNAFAWRVAGVAFGAALVALVYLLGATMFGRRRLAALAAGFVAVDGMSYVMSRIAMNDIFVTVFIVAAYLAFWQIWSGRWARSAWWVLPLVGVLIGLAAATKWVGFYALAGIWILVLARSSLGRLVLVGLVAFGTVVGGLGAPWPFLVTMLLAMAIAMAIVHQRPIRLDARAAMVALPATGVVIGAVGIGFAVAYGQIDHRDANGAVEVVFGMLARGAQVGWPAWVMLGVAGVLIAWRAWRSLRDANSDARWHQPDEMGGFAWSWVGACLVVVPLTVYALSYIPYLQLGHVFAGPDSGPGYGWSLEELHAQMFGYHFGLTAGHASSSPWWSWPLDLKPTWFFNGSYDGEQIAVIYNGGNPILFWAGVPAIAACGVLAWKRRSAALVLLVAAFAFQLAPWTRIERATFAYHYLTAVIFAMIAVAYVVDELLRRPAWRDVALGYLALVVVAGALVFPLGAALPMPDWYINAARALPPWNYAFQFPDPPQGDRGDLVSISGLTLVVGVLVSVAAVAWSLRGRQWGAPFWSTFVARRRVRE